MPRELFKNINQRQPVLPPTKLPAQIDRRAVTRASAMSGGLVVGASIGGATGTLLGGPIGALFGAATGATVGGILGAAGGSFIGGHYDKSAIGKRVKEAKEIKLSDENEQKIFESVEKELNKLDFLIEKYVEHNIPIRGLENKLEEIRQKLEKLKENKVLTHAQAKLIETALVAYIFDKRGRTDDDIEKRDQALLVLKLMVEEYKQLLRNEQRHVNSSTAIARELRKTILEPLTHDTFFKLVDLYLNKSNAAYKYTGEGTNLNLRQINGLEKLNAEIEAVSSQIEINKMLFDTLPESKEKNELFIKLTESDEELRQLYKQQNEILSTQDPDVLSILERTQANVSSSVSSAKSSTQNSPSTSPPDTPNNKRREEKGKEIAEEENHPPRPKG